MESKSGARCTRAIRSALVGIAFLVIAAPVALAQETDKASTEVQQLKEKLQKLEQTVHELKTQLSAMQQPQIAPAANTPSSSAVPPSDKTTVTETTAVATKPTVPSRSTQENEKKGENTFQVYGFAMLDFGYQFKQNDPDWFDVIRPTKLPASKDQFAPDGKTYFGVRQSRLGVKSTTATPLGELKTQFEFELFGTGVDAGQTTFRLRHAYGEMGHWGAGQTWSPFMDPDVFPNSIEYWGPNGMVFFRNVQARWMPLMGKNEAFLALERPGASGDPGIFVAAPQVANATRRFPPPGLSGHYRMNRGWGHLQIAGILRRMEWDDTDPAAPNLSGSATGWGVNVSSNLKFSKDTLRLQVVYGEGIANYM